MVPVAGSAYTYAYATMGELVAWIIGWDLILEYAIASSAVAAGWSNYLDAFLHNVFHIQIDPRFSSAPWDYDVGQGTFILKTVALADGQTVMAWFNLPAVLITAAVTVVLVIGVKESAGLNAAMVLLNIGVILTVVGVGAAYIEPSNWRPFLHEDKGWRGVAEGAGRIFFAYIGFDSISTHAEEARRPQRDLAIGMMGALHDLHDLVCRGRGRADRNGSLSSDRRQRSAVRGLARPRPDVRGRADHAGDPGRHDQLAPGRQLEPAAHSAGDGARWALASGDLRGDPSSVQNAMEVDDPGGRRRRGDGRAGPPGFPGGIGQHRYPFRLRDRLGRGLDPPHHRPGCPAPVSRALGAFRLDHGHIGQWRI